MEPKQDKNEDDRMNKTDNSYVNEYSKDDFLNESDFEAIEKSLNEQSSKNLTQNKENGIDRNLEDKNLLEKLEKLNEEDIMKIINKCILFIAECFIQSNQSVYKLYNNRIKTIEFEGEMINVLTPEDFLEGLQQIKVTKLTKLELHCLINLLNLNLKEKYIKVNDLIQLLNKFNIQDKEANALINTQIEDSSFIDYNELDQVSFALLISILDFLNTENISVYQLMGHMIEKRQSNFGKDTDIISTKNFFKILHKIGIEVTEANNENLIKFLSFDEMDKNYLEVKKIKNAVEGLVKDDRLYVFARKCYDALVEQDSKRNTINNKKLILEKPENEE